MITEREIIVRFQKRAHNPLLMAAGFDKTNLPVPWLEIGAYSWSSGNTVTMWQDRWARILSATPVGSRARRATRCCGRRRVCAGSVPYVPR